MSETVKIYANDYTNFNRKIYLSVEITGPWHYAGASPRGSEESLRGSRMFFATDEGGKKWYTWQPISDATASNIGVLLYDAFDDERGISEKGSKRLHELLANLKWRPERPLPVFNRSRVWAVDRTREEFYDGSTVYTVVRTGGERSGTEWFSTMNEKLAFAAAKEADHLIALYGEEDGMRAVEALDWVLSQHPSAAEEILGEKITDIAKLHFADWKPPRRLQAAEDAAEKWEGYAYELDLTDPVRDWLDEQPPKGGILLADAFNKAGIH